MDREPSKLLDEAAELIAKASADTAGQAAQRASHATGSTRRSLWHGTSMVIDSPTTSAAS